jgi:hypothetical protein
MKDSKRTLAIVVKVLEQTEGGETITLAHHQELYAEANGFALDDPAFKKDLLAAAYDGFELARNRALHVEPDEP